MNYTLS